MIVFREPSAKPGKRWRDLALSLWLTSTILLAPLLILPFFMDWRDAFWSVVESWQLYLLFFALPYVLGGVAWIAGRRVDRMTSDGGTDAVDR